MRRWPLELGVVGIALGATVALTGGDWRQWVAAAAVLAGFAHAQVSDRFAEAEAARARALEQWSLAASPAAASSGPSVRCWRWSLRYLVLKEVLWCAFFLSIRSWASLVGVAAFLLYPLWRAWYRRRHPLGRSS